MGDNNIEIKLESGGERKADSEMVRGAERGQQDSTRTW